MSQIKSCPKCSAPAAAPALADSHAQVRCPVCHAEYALHEALDFHVPEFHLVQPGNGSAPAAPPPSFSDELGLPLAFDAHGSPVADALHLDADWKGIDAAAGHGLGDEPPQPIVPSPTPLAGSFELPDDAALRQPHRVEPHAHSDEADLLGLSPEGDEVHFDFTDAPATEPEAHIPPHGDSVAGEHGLGEAAFGPRGPGELAVEVGGMEPIDRAHELGVDPFASAHDGGDLGFRDESHSSEHHDGVGEAAHAANVFGEDEAFMPADDFGVDLNLKDDSAGDDALEPVGAGAAMGAGALGSGSSKVGKRGDGSGPAPVAPRPKQQLNLGKYVIRTCVVMVLLIPVAFVLGVWVFHKDNMGLTKYLPNSILPAALQHPDNDKALAKSSPAPKPPAAPATAKPDMKVLDDGEGSKAIEDPTDPTRPIIPAPVPFDTDPAVPPIVKPVPVKPADATKPDEPVKPEDPTKIDDNPVKVPLPPLDGIDEPPAPKKPVVDPPEMKKPGDDPAVTTPKPPVDPTLPEVKPAPPVEPKPETPAEPKATPKAPDPFDTTPPEVKPADPTKPADTTKPVDTKPADTKPTDTKPAVEPEPKTPKPATEPADPFDVKTEPAKPAVEPVGPRNPPKYQAADLEQAVKDANGALAALAAADANNRDQLRSARVSYYRALCHLAEVYPNAAASGDMPNPAFAASLALLNNLAGDRARAEELGALGGFWFKAPARKESKETGIALAGTLKSIARQGKVYESTLVTFGKPTEIVLLSADLPPVEEGGAVLVLGGVVANPAENVAGYTGKADEAVWVGPGWRKLAAASDPAKAKPPEPAALPVAKPAAK